MKKNYWTLGYFGGGAVNIVEAHKLAKDFAECVGVPLERVFMDEILYSSRYKGFKFLFSDVQDQEPEEDSYQTDNVMGWLHD
jgi:hypothetical protein